MSGQYGSYSAAVEEEIERFSQFKWLLPDTEAERADSDFVCWLEERFDAHLGALAPFVPSEQSLPSPRVLVSRSIYDTNERIESLSERWLQQKDEGSEAWRKTLRALDRKMRRENEKSQDSRLGWRVACDAAVRSASLSLALPEAHQKTLALFLPEFPASATIRSHISWLYAFGKDSPWASIVELWGRGLWPLATPVGSLLVYIPIVHEETIIPDAERPNWGEVPRKKPSSWVMRTSFVELQGYGFGWLPALPVKPVEPKPAPPETPIQAEPAKLPWYRRIFK